MTTENQTTDVVALARRWATEMDSANGDCILAALDRQATEIERLRTDTRALRQALRWCVVNDGETLFDHPRLLRRFRYILGMEEPTDAE